MALGKLLEGSKGLNTSQIIHSMGDIEGSRQDTARQMLNDRKLQLEVEAKNRQEANLAKRAEMGFQGFGVRTPEQGKIGETVIREPGKAPKDTKAKAGLKAGTGTGTGTAAKTKPGLKTKTEAKDKGKIVNAWDATELPPELNFWKDFQYEGKKGPLVQGEDESSAAFAIRQGVEAINPITAERISYGAAIAHMGQYERAMADTMGPSGSPEKWKAAGFKDQRELSKFADASREHEQTINTWFAKRPGVAQQFSKLPLNKQTQTIKHILSQAGKLEEGETTQVAKEAKSVASDIKKVKEAAGLPATSAVEEEAPNRPRDIRLVENPGKPRERWADTLQKREELAVVYQQKQREYSMLIRQNTPQSRKQAEVLRKEGELLRADGLALEYAANKYENMQALQDWRNSGDPRHLQGRLSEINDGETHIQPLDNGNYNVLVRDAETGEFVVQHANVTEADISTSFQRRTDEDFETSYQALIAETRKSQMEFQEEVLLEKLKGMLDIQKEVAGERAKATYGTGEDAKPFNVYVDGENMSVVKKDGQWHLLKGGVEVPGGKSQEMWTPISDDLGAALSALRKGNQEKT